MGQSERWRHAAREVSGIGKSTTRFREDVADAAVRVLLEELQAMAVTGGNMDDGLWYRRFSELMPRERTE